MPIVTELLTDAILIEKAKLAISSLLKDYCLFVAIYVICLFLV